MPGNAPSQQQSAKHLAARAVMAYRAGFPVALISVTSSRKRPSGIVCDWKGQRDSFQNDEKLLGRAFAFVYIGSIQSLQKNQLVPKINTTRRCHRAVSLV